LVATMVAPSPLLQCRRSRSDDEAIKDDVDWAGL
jgi:hypothetical protein